MPDTLGERLKAWRLLAEGLKPRPTPSSAWSPLDILQPLRAVADYCIHGAQGLQEAVEHAIGKLTVHCLRAKKQGAPLNLGHLDRHLDLILKVETLLAKAHVYLPAIAESCRSSWEPEPMADLRRLERLGKYKVVRRSVFRSCNNLRQPSLRRWPNFPRRQLGATTPANEALGVA